MKQNKQKTESKGNYFVRQPQLETALIKADLTRGIVVTILALFLEIGLYVYLQSGGWQKVLPVLLSIKL
jgi:hypothetical protein